MKKNKYLIYGIACIVGNGLGAYQGYKDGKAPETIGNYIGFYLLGIIGIGLIIYHFKHKND